MVCFRDLAQEVKEEVIAWRRELHRHPEVSMQEFRTAERVEEELRKMGIEIRRHGDTAVIGILKGAKPGKTVALRADMDALSLTEENDVPYASEVEGVMHACGHDAHVATLLGAAKVLSQVRDQLPGTVKFFFQPGEEVAQGPAHCRSWGKWMMWMQSLVSTCGPTCRQLRSRRTGSADGLRDMFQDPRHRQVATLPSPPDH